MQRFHKICCYFGQNPKCKGSISPSNFDEQVSNILFTDLCLCVGHLRLLGCYSGLIPKCKGSVILPILMALKEGIISKHMGEEGHE